MAPTNPTVAGQSQQGVPSLADRSGHLASLDGLRAVAIAMVIIAHQCGQLEEKGLLRLPASLQTILANLGGLGVCLFFNLSGYLITYLLIKERRERGSISLRKFYIRRFLRICPALYLYLSVITVCVMLGVLAVSRKDLLVAALFVRNYVPFDADPTKPGWYVGHTWSLGIEEQFYLFWPTVLVLVGLRRSRFVALGLIVAMPLLRVALYFLFPAGRHSLMVDMHSCADRMMYGSLLALLDGHPRLEKILSKAPSRLMVIVPLLFVAIVDPLIQQRVRGSYTLTLSLPLVSLSLVFLIASLLRRPDCQAARLLNLPFVASMGTLSYSLYLWQQPFLSPSNASFLGRFPANLLFTVGAAMASFYLVEKPIMRLRQRFRSV